MKFSEASKNDPRKIQAFPHRRREIQKCSEISSRGKYSIILWFLPENFQKISLTH